MLEELISKYKSNEFKDKSKTFLKSFLIENIPEFAVTSIYTLIVASTASYDSLNNLVVINEAVDSVFKTSPFIMGGVFVGSYITYKSAAHELQKVSKLENPNFLDYFKTSSKIGVNSIIGTSIGVVLTSLEYFGVYYLFNWAYKLFY